MFSYRVEKGAGIAALALGQSEAPVPGRGQVLVRVRAASLNFRELMIVEKGQYPLPIKPHLIPASDGAGEVAAVGDGVTRVRAGDRVVGQIFPQWTDGPFRWDHAAQVGGSCDGMLTELAVLDEEGALAIPSHLSFEEAATLPCAGVTAWNALVGGAPLEPGQTVLTLGSGGVSLFALQLAKLHGARVIATTSSPDKARRLTALGADAVVDYRATPDWHLAVRELTGGAGVDRVVEVGGTGTLARSIRCLAGDGHISLVGSLSPDATPLEPSALNGFVGTIRRLAVGSRAQFVAMNRAIELHRLRPVIDRVFAFRDAPEAFRYYAAGHAFGKVVIQID